MSRGALLLESLTMQARIELSSVNACCHTILSLTSNVFYGIQ